MRLALKGLTVLAIGASLSWTFGHIPFTPGMTEALIRVTTWLGINGVEDVEDFFVVATMFLSSALAVGVGAWLQ